MSAIWGTISFHNTPPDSVDSIMQKPYRDNYKIDRYQSAFYKNCYMGCGIQHITAESRTERLPILDNDKDILITTDCILDNREELISDLSLHDESMPDGELVYLSYLKWGIDCVKHFRGLFTLAVWEQRTKTLYLANDPLSTRCLYYYRTTNEVTFSTLLAPITALHTDITQNELYLMDFLAAPLLIPNVVDNETPYLNVHKLLPATILTITENELTETTYWTPDSPLPDFNCKTAEEYGKYFRQLITNCVADAIRTDSNVGIALSSGLDSSTVGTIAADLLQSKDKNLFAGTYVPYESAPQNTKNHIYNETADVNEIVKMHPNILPHFLCNEGKNALDSIPDGIRTVEIPYKAFVNYPNLCEIYQKAAEADCRVVLSGQMGNSTISYGNMDPVFFDLYLKKKYIYLLKCLNNLAKHMKISRKQFIPSYLKYLKDCSKKAKKTTPEYSIDNPYLSDVFKKYYPLTERFNLGKMYNFSELPYSQKHYRQLLFSIPGACYMGEWETKIGLKYGILLRDPTKDIRILSFCYHLPYHIFAWRGTTKWLIRGNMKDMLPQYILNNFDRHGIQNVDWYIRIARDWDRIKTQWQADLINPQIQYYINTEAILSLINSPDFSISALNDSNRIYLFTIYFITQYLKAF